MSNPGAGHRPDMMFLQTQNMPWVEHASRGHGCRRRLLNRNADTGAETFVMQLDREYAQSRAACLAHDFEFFVVHGAVEINGVSYGPYSYGIHPAGYEHRAVTSATGAVLIVMTMGGPDGLTARPAGAFRPDRLLVMRDTAALPWVLGVDRALLASAASVPPTAAPSSTPRPPPEPSTMTKLIWQDPDSKGYTFMKSDLPRFQFGPQSARSHTIDAEYFVLHGDYIISGEGRINPGGYFCWAAGAMHGPSACENLSLVLVKYYGPVGLIPSTDKIDVVLDPPHRPTIDAARYGFAAPIALPEIWS